MLFGPQYGYVQVSPLPLSVLLSVPVGAQLGVYFHTCIEYGLCLSKRWNQKQVVLPVQVSTCLNRTRDADIVSQSGMKRGEQKQGMKSVLSCSSLEHVCRVSSLVKWTALIPCAAQHKVVYGVNRCTVSKSLCRSYRRFSSTFNQLIVLAWKKMSSSTFIFFSAWMLMPW